MTRTRRQKRLTCFISHAPHFECCFPILARLQARGRIEVDPVINARMRRTDPGIVEAFRQEGLRARFQSRLRIEALSYPDMRRADAVLSYGDPLALRKGIRLRDFYLPASGTPSIFIQHGLIQEGVNLDWHGLGREWYASLILWWDRFDPAVSGFLSEETRARIRTVGFIKKNHLPLRPVPPEIAARLARYRQRLLVATTIPGQAHRFSPENLAQTYAMLGAFARRHPDIVLIIRPHRGKTNDAGRDLDTALDAAHDNVIVMDRYEGPFAYWNMHDSLQLCDGVIAHASSAVLDAIYANLPMAMLHNDRATFDPLPDITDLETLEAFSAGLNTIDVFHNPVRALFGELDANLDHAASLIEDFMLAPGGRG